MNSLNECSITKKAESSSDDSSSDEDEKAKKTVAKPPDVKKAESINLQFDVSNIKVILPI